MAGKINWIDLHIKFHDIKYDNFKELPYFWDATGKYGSMSPKFLRTKFLKK